MRWLSPELARMMESQTVVREEGTNVAFQSISFNLKIPVKNKAIFVSPCGAQLQWYIAFESRCMQKKILLLFSFPQRFFTLPIVNISYQPPVFPMNLNYLG